MAANGRFSEWEFICLVRLFCKVLSKQVVSDPKVRQPHGRLNGANACPHKNRGVAITPPQYEQTQTYVRTCLGYFTPHRTKTWVESAVVTLKAAAGSGWLSRPRLPVALLAFSLRSPCTAMHLPTPNAARTPGGREIISCDLARMPASPHRRRPCSHLAKAPRTQVLEASPDS